MDDRVWYLAIGTLVAAVVVVFLDAALDTFDTPAGFWTVEAGILGFLGALTTLRRNGRNGAG